MENEIEGGVLVLLSHPRKKALDVAILLNRRISNNQGQLVF